MGRTIAGVEPNGMCCKTIVPPRGEQINICFLLAKVNTARGAPWLSREFMPNFR
mgnify:CR=1 FL=1